MSDKLFRFAFVAVLGLAFGFGSFAYIATDNPPGVIQTAEIESAGIFFNRPEAERRTQPVDPNATVAPAPSFEAPPSVQPSVGSIPAELTPEQKDQLYSIIKQVATLLIGAFLGSGSASPFIALILEKLLGAVKGSEQKASTKRIRKKKAAPSK